MLTLEESEAGPKNRGSRKWGRGKNGAASFHKTYLSIVLSLNYILKIPLAFERNNSKRNFFVVFFGDKLTFYLVNLYVLRLWDVHDYITEKTFISCVGKRLFSKEMFSGRLISVMRRYNTLLELTQLEEETEELTLWKPTKKSIIKLSAYSVHRFKVFHLFR